MIGLEEFYSEALEVLMPDRNNVKALEPTQEHPPRPLEARVSTHLIEAFYGEKVSRAPIGSAA
jgi:hypothetical protein